MDIIDQIKPAIIAVLLADENQDAQNAMTLGTGFFVTSDGYILTCHHVVEPLIESKSPILVKTTNGIFEADYIADKSRSEKYLDWAVLKVKLDEKDKENFPCLRLFAECKQGDEWCTIGYELAERANGIPNMGDIIGLYNRREAPSQDIDLKSANPIRPGVSGSPLFNKRTGSVAGLIKEVVKDTQAFATSIESVLKAWPGLEKLNSQSESLIYIIDIWGRWLQWADKRCNRLIENELNWIDRDPNLDLGTLPLMELWDEFINANYWHENLLNDLMNMCSECSNPSLANQIQNIVNNINLVNNIYWDGDYEILLRTTRKDLKVLQNQIKSSKSDIYNTLTTLYRRLDDPKFGRCFLVIGGIGSGKTHFIASTLKYRANYNCIIFPLRLDPSEDVGSLILKEAKSSTGIEWVDLNEFFSYLKNINEHLISANKKQLRIVIAIDDLQRWISSKDGFLDYLQNMIQDWTKWPLFWIITLHDTCYGDVSEKRNQTRFWEKYSPLSENFGKNFYIKEITEGELPYIDGWISLDYINSWKKIGIELIERSMTEADIRSLRNYPVEIENQDLCNPLIALLSIYLYEKNFQVIAIFNMNFIEFIKLFWDIRKEALLDIARNYPKLKEDPWISKLNKDRIDRSITLIAKNLLQTNNFTQYQSLKNFIDCVVESAQDTKEFPDNSLNNIDLVKKIFYVLEKGNMIECKNEKTTSFYEAFKTREFKILFEKFWEYSLTEPLVVEYIIKGKSVQYPLMNLEKWFSKVRPEGTKRGVFQFLLLTLEDERFKNKLSTEQIEEIWHLGLSSKELPSEAVWFAGPKASKNIQKMLVKLALDYEITQNFRIIMFSFMYFLREASFDVDVISISHRLKLLQRYFKMIEEGNLSGYYLNVARVLIDKINDNDIMLDCMQYFHGSEVMGIAEKLANATFKCIEQNAKTTDEIMEIIIDYIKKNGHQVQIEYEKRRKANLEPKKWRRYFYIEYVLKAFTHHLSREIGAYAYNFLKDNNWFEPNKKNIIYKRIKLFMEQEANIALGQRYRIYSELGPSFEIKRNEFLDLLEDLVKSSSEKDRLNAFHIIRHTVRTGIEGTNESDYVVADLFEYYLIEIFLDLQSSASPSSKWHLNRFYPFFAANISDLSSVHNPSDESSWCKKGIILNNLNRYEDAYNCFNKSIDINPRYIMAWCNKGITLDFLKRYEYAIKAYNKVLEFSPKDAVDWNYTAITLASLNRFDEALIAFDKAIEANPNYADAWCNKGITLFDVGRYDESLLAYDKSIKLDPKHIDAWYNKGIALDNQERYDEAIRAYDRAIKIDPRYADVWYNKGIALDNQERYDEAIRAYDRAIKIKPNFAMAWNNKGIAFDNQGKHDEAIKCYDEAIKIEPNFAMAWNNKGIDLEKLDKIAEANAAFAKAKELETNGQ